MSKAFTKEIDEPDDDAEVEPSQPAGVKNYITPQGHARMKAEFLQLMDVERPEMVATVSWAAKNGDRSENGDYLYGKKRLREIDRRIRFLTKRLDIAEVIDPATREGTEQIFFGATVTLLDDKRQEHTYSIVGMDEIDLASGRVSWISPIAKALMKAREGDVVKLQTPGGERELEIIEVIYKALG
ncbi:MAG: transcription elongation factor GreB [Burkholderiales bacterium]